MLCLEQQLFGSCLDWRDLHRNWEKLRFRNRPTEQQRHVKMILGIDIFSWKKGERKKVLSARNVLPFEKGNAVFCTSLFTVGFYAKKRNVTAPPCVGNRWLFTWLYFIIPLCKIVRNNQQIPASVSRKITDKHNQNIEPEMQFIRVSLRSSTGLKLVLEKSQNLLFIEANTIR